MSVHLSIDAPAAPPHQPAPPQQPAYLRAIPLVKRANRKPSLDNLDPYILIVDHTEHAHCGE